MKKNIRIIIPSIALLICVSFLLKKDTLWGLKQNKATREGIAMNPILAGKRYFLGSLAKDWKYGTLPTKQEVAEFKKLLGYNPNIQYILDTNTIDVINQKRPTLFFHGFGDMKNSAKLFKEFYDILPGNIITFQFHDWGPGIPWVTKSSLGQLPDVIPALLALKWAKNRLNIDGVDLYGYSRGGATILNMIYVLQANDYDAALQDVGIDKIEKKELLSLIENGSIVLDAPLRDANETAKKFLGRLESGVKPVLSKISKYDPEGLQGLSSAQKMKNVRLKSLLHFQHNDTIVFNKSEGKLYSALYASNPETTYLVLGDEGGHIHNRQSLANAIHIFRKKFGGSYNPKYVEQYQNQEKTGDISGILLQPSPQEVVSVIKNYYVSRKKK